MVKFPDKERHQLFLEPEGLNTNEIYVQGMSSSLPEEVQIALYRTIPGLEHVRFMRTAYAIEYDCINPLQMKSSLMTKHLKGIFTAGQINGTSGYEEAAAQGIIAGINAVLYIREEEPVVLSRDMAYAGVLIDDLVTKGTKEPYRMMTSRAEYRLLLRQDNADERLTEIGRRVGLVTDERYDAFMRKQEAVQGEIKRLWNTNARMGEELDGFLEQKGQPASNKSLPLAELLRRPGIKYEDLQALSELPPLEREVVRSVETKIKYEGYIKKQLSAVEKFRSMENKKLPADMDYSKIQGIRLEARAKLNDFKPENIGQAARISGVSPSDISVLLVYFEKMKRQGV